MRGAVLALTAGLMANAALAVPGLEPGVSRELALWRAKYYRDVRYALAISVTAGATKLAGTATVEVTLRSEERRVGKECRVRGARIELKKYHESIVRVTLVVVYIGL